MPLIPRTLMTIASSTPLRRWRYSSAMIPLTVLDMNHLATRFRDPIPTPHRSVRFDHHRGVLHLHAGGHGAAQRDLLDDRALDRRGPRLLQRAHEVVEVLDQRRVGERHLPDHRVDVPAL